MEKSELMKKYEQETGETLDMSVLSYDAIGSWHGYIGAIEAENQKLRDDASEVLIRDLQFHGGFLSLEAETSLGRVYAEYASHILEEYKAQNFVTCELKAGNSEQMFYLTIGRCDGKTVQEKYLEVCNEKVALEAKATAYDRLMSGEPTAKEIANVLNRIIAMDADFKWYAFGVIPYGTTKFRWVAVRGSTKYRVPCFNIKFDGDWKDSLTLPDGWEEV